MLTREEAQQLVLTRLKARQDAGDYVVEENRTLERQFGWLFFVGVSGSSETAQAKTVSHRLIIVNKHVEQVIESSIGYTPDRFIEVYETLLAKSQASWQGWCQTVSFPLSWRGFLRGRLTKKAKEMGLHEIG
ncbi:MAG TPA: hypothetical protein VFU31_16250 [Candidatus Binatia bacterium]|nr:hypothetical protein [Candidatus Binatia bacterium]